MRASDSGSPCHGVRLLRIINDYLTKAKLGEIGLEMSGCRKVKWKE